MQNAYPVKQLYTACTGFLHFSTHYCFSSKRCLFKNTVPKS